VSVLRRGVQLSLHDPECGRPDESQTQPPALAVAGPLSAAALLKVFTQHRAQWFSADVDDSAQRIAELLTSERELSERWEGLPGTEHPYHWASVPELAPAVVQKGTRGCCVAVWHPPLWWAMPVVRRRPRHLRMELPLAKTLPELEAMVACAVPPRWRARPVTVRLELETRVYWGGRATGVLRGDRSAAVHWRPCRVRGDGLTTSEDLLVVRHGRALPGTLGDDDLSVTLTRHLHGGIGLLVAVPVLVLERAPQWHERALQRLDAAWDCLWRRLGGTRGRDRDPTFARRVAYDETFWQDVLGKAPMPTAAWRRALRDGALLRPASPAALRHDASDAAQAAQCHVVLVHGGLSSVRSGFEGWLSPNRARDDDPPPTPLAEKGAVWGNMPALDDTPTWRFEHDTFVPLAHNIARLERCLARCVIGSAPRGRIVFVAHSRGGCLVRFALERLRHRFGPAWTFQAMTAGAPHLGTQVFRRIGRRWAGVAALVGIVRKLGDSWLDREQLEQLLILERGLAYQVPAGFLDVEPSSVRRMALGRPRDLPEGMWLWGSSWGPATTALPMEDGLWHWLVEDIGGAEVGGDGLVARESALAGRSDPVLGAHDASPVFHTHYFAHEPTRAQMARVLSTLLQTP
jgi:hypothetical protein